MRRSVYIETSFLGFLTARPSRDVLVTAHRLVTKRWWAHYRHHFDEIIAGIRRLRDEHARAFNYDLKAIIADYRKKAREAKRRLGTSRAKHSHQTKKTV